MDNSIEDLIENVINNEKDYIFKNNKILIEIT